MNDVPHNGVKNERKTPMNAPSGIYGHKGMARYRHSPGTSVPEACERVKSHLEGKVERSTEFKAWARQVGINAGALRDARNAVPVRATKIGDNWYCSLHEVTAEERAKIRGKDASPSPPICLTLNFRQDVPAGTYVLTPRAKIASSAVSASAERPPEEGESGDVSVSPVNTHSK
jgi:hypothetical protein